MKFRSIDVAIAEAFVKTNEWMDNIKDYGSCKVWVGQLSRDGYAFVRIPGEKQPFYGHRVSWVADHHQDVPPGLVIDHLCRNRNCVLAEHGDPVSQRENLRRGAYWRKVARLMKPKEE